MFLPQKRLKKQAFPSVFTLKTLKNAWIIKRFYNFTSVLNSVQNLIEHNAKDKNSCNNLRDPPEAGDRGPQGMEPI